MNQPNPAWKGLLDKLPPALHPMVIPVLEEWDKGVQAKFQEIHSEYEEYKPFKQFIDNNITPEFAWQSVVLADELQREPAKIAAQINENWNLGLVTKDEFDKAVAERPASNEGDDDMFNNDDSTQIDLSKIPEFATMKQTLEAMQSSSEEERRREQEAQELADFEKELSDLEKSVTTPEDGSEGKPFNKMFVTALMAQGLSGEDAVKQFHELLGKTAVIPTDDGTPSTTTDAPITMGNGGTVGSGQGDGSVDWNSLTTSDFNANVAKILEAQMGQNT